MNFSTVRKFLQTSSRFIAKSNRSFYPLASSTQTRLRFYSSDSNSVKLPPTEDKSASADVEDVSTAELKRRIENMLNGEPDAIPSIFEAILRRKLTGNHDESDEELLGELRSRTVDDEESDGESASDQE